MSTILGTYNPNIITKNPIQELVKSKHIRTGVTKTKRGKQIAMDRRQKQKGWE